MTRILLLFLLTFSSFFVVGQDQKTIYLFASVGAKEMNDLIAYNHQNDLRGESSKNRYYFDFEAVVDKLPAGVWALKFSELGAKKDLSTQFINDLNAKLVAINQLIPAGKPKIYVGLNAYLGEAFTNNEVGIVTGTTTVATLAEFESKIIVTKKREWDAVNTAYGKIITDMTAAIDLTSQPDGVEIIQYGIFSEFRPELINGNEDIGVHDWQRENFVYLPGSNSNTTIGFRIKEFDTNIRNSVFHSLSVPTLRDPQYPNKYNSASILEHLTQFADNIQLALNGKITVVDCSSYPSSLPKPLLQYTTPSDLVEELNRYEEVCFKKMTVLERLHVLNVLKTAPLVDRKNFFKTVLNSGTLGSENIAVAVIATTPPEQVDEFLKQIEIKKLHLDLIQKIDDEVVWVGDNNFTKLCTAFKDLLLKSPTLDKRYSKSFAAIDDLIKNAYVWDKSYAVSLPGSEPIGNYTHIVSLDASTGEIKTQNTFVESYTWVTAIDPVTGQFTTLPVAIPRTEVPPRRHSPFDLILLTDNSKLGLFESTQNGFALVPAIYLYYASEKKWNDDAFKAVSLGFDGLMFASGIGEYTALAKEAPSIVNWLRKGWVATQVVGAVGNAAVTLTDNTGKLNDIVQVYNAIFLAVGVKNFVKGGVNNLRTMMGLPEMRLGFRVPKAYANEYVGLYLSLSTRITNLVNASDQNAIALAKLRQLIVDETKIISNQSIYKPFFTKTGLIAESEEAKSWYKRVLLVPSSGNSQGQIFWLNGVESEYQSYVSATKTTVLSRLDWAATTAKKFANLYDLKPISYEGAISNITGITFRTTDDIVDVIVHAENSQYVIWIDNVKRTIDESTFASIISQNIPANKQIRLLSCSDLSSAAGLAKTLNRDIIASDGVLKIYTDGSIVSGPFYIVGKDGTKLATESFSPVRITTDFTKFVKLGTGNANYSYGKLIQTQHLGGKRLSYSLKDFFANPSGTTSLGSFSELADKVTVPKTLNVLYMDFFIPKSVNDLIKAQEDLFGKVSVGFEMFDDSYKFFKVKVGKELDGIYGEWIKSPAYAEYGGESINLKRFRDAINAGETDEVAAFKTVTGEWANSKGFTKVKFFKNQNEFTPQLDRFDLNNRVEVLFYK
jgi:hypothetical protein